MAVKQISVFLPNKKGMLAQVSRYLADNNIDLKTLSIADTQDFGILRLICENVDDVEKILKDGGYLTVITDVLVTSIKNVPGALASITEALSEADVSVEYVYEFPTVSENILFVFRVDDNKVAAAALAGAGIKILKEEDLF